LQQLAAPWSEWSNLIAGREGPMSEWALTAQVRATASYFFCFWLSFIAIFGEPQAWTNISKQTVKFSKCMPLIIQFIKILFNVDPFSSEIALLPASSAVVFYFYFYLSCFYVQGRTQPIYTDPVLSTIRM
jgi:hypothetical protein